MPWVHYRIGVALLMKNEGQAALDEFGMESDEVFKLQGSAMALYSLGRTDEFAQAFLKLREWGEDAPFEVAEVYAWVGNSDAAFAWLDKAADEFPRGELFNSLHTDPRWEAYRKQMAAAHEQSAQVEFRVALPD